jgi:peptide/nickel transport system substrate-binding protein
MKFRSVALIAAVLALSSPVDAKTFRWANGADVNSMDPYARQETFLLSFMSNIYEPLVRRDRELKLEPALAVKWTQTSPTVWRFDLRPNVKFQDGTPFTADDVVFSLGRAAGEGSNLRSLFASLKAVRKVDAATVEVETNSPDPVFADKMTQVGMMSKAWCEQNGAQRSADLTKKEENHATRNAMGTGPFMLKSREPDVRTVLVPNPNWWDKPEHNLTEIQFSVVANDATRVAALLSGQIDMMYTVPPQDVDRISRTEGVRVLQKPELRTIFLGFDQTHDELADSNIKGKNPFKDVRVRRAFYQAIDVEAIRSRVMRNQATPTGLMLGPGLSGFSEKLNVRLPYDPEASKKLLAEAGYPTGFEVGMDCPQNRYVHDDEICQAVVAMLARIGVKVSLNAQPPLKYFAKVLGPSYNTSFYLLGWTPATTYDVHNVFEQIMLTRDTTRHRGEFNLGGWTNKRFDEVVDQIEQETDRTKRAILIEEAHRIHQQEVGHIPLHQQALVWAASTNVTLVQLADNFFPLRYVTLT